MLEKCIEYQKLLLGLFNDEKWIEDLILCFWIRDLGDDRSNFIALSGDPLGW